MPFTLRHLLSFVVVGVLAGNEFGSRFVVHPALDALSARSGSRPSRRSTAGAAG